MENQSHQRENPIHDLISDEIYELLKTKGLLNEKIIRDIQIRKQFKFMRANKISASAAIEKLREEYPYLQYDSIRKIVYNRS